MRAPEVHLQLPGAVHGHQGLPEARRELRFGVGGGVAGAGGGAWAARRVRPGTGRPPAHLLQAPRQLVRGAGAHLPCHVVGAAHVRWAWGSARTMRQGSGRTARRGTADPRPLGSWCRVRGRAGGRRCASQAIAGARLPQRAAALRANAPARAPSACSPAVNCASASSALRASGPSSGAAAAACAARAASSTATSAASVPRMALKCREKDINALLIGSAASHV